MKKKIQKENPFKSLGVGYAHYLRNGAGAHQDKKKEQKRKECRGKIKTSDWKSYFFASCRSCVTFGNEACLD